MKKFSKKLKNIFQPANRLQVGLLKCRYKSKKEVEYAKYSRTPSNDFADFMREKK